MYWEKREGKMSKFRKSQGLWYTQSKRGTPQDRDAKLVIALSPKSYQKPLGLQKDNCASILDGKETGARGWRVPITIQLRDRW